VAIDNRGARIAVNALVVVAALVTAVRWWSYRPVAEPEVERPAERLVLGSELSLPLPDWNNDTVVVLFVRSTCPTCNASAPFYKRLSEAVAAKASAVRLVIVSQEPETLVGPWLRAAGISADLILTDENLGDLGVAWVPTLIFTNATRKVTDIVNRGLTQDEELSVIAKLSNPSLPALDVARYAPFVSERELSTKAGMGYLLLDVRSREAFDAGHSAGATNIPYDEVDLRASVEIPFDRTVVIDCRRGRLSWCDVAAATLLDRQVSLIRSRGRFNYAA